MHIIHALFIAIEYFYFTHTMAENWDIDAAYKDVIKLIENCGHDYNDALKPCSKILKTYQYEIRTIFSRTNLNGTAYYLAISNQHVTKNI